MSIWVMDASSSGPACMGSSSGSCPYRLLCQLRAEPARVCIDRALACDRMPALSDAVLDRPAKRISRNKRGKSPDRALREGAHDCPLDPAVAVLPIYCSPNQRTQQLRHLRSLLVVERMPTGGGSEASPFDVTRVRRSSARRLRRDQRQISGRHKALRVDELA